MHDYRRRQTTQNERHKKRSLSPFHSNLCLLICCDMADLFRSCDVPALFCARIKRPNHTWESSLMLIAHNGKKITQSFCATPLICIIRLWNTVSAVNFKWPLNTGNKWESYVCEKPPPCTEWSILTEINRTGYKDEIFIQSPHAVQRAKEIYLRLLVYL